ncbi:hypothetical protein EVG20_g9712 [Dentipellis fragilis]|uniref:Uncharacterized protein n=1 Tax=Dentipellis fragilis TaxID=205917 RepID=A0A4Y9XYB5_9AGAM|nr:hypothetical protein EVG20_g9712 [Dentipellis fragilis]
MATVTARNSKFKRVEPYAATAPKKRKFKAATSSSPSNGSSSSSLLELYPNGPWSWRETMHEASKRYVHGLSPHITPQDDYELSLLLFGGFDKNGTIGEFQEYVTDMLEISWDTNRRMGKKNAIAKLREDAKKQMDGPSFLTGVCTFSSSLFSANKLTCSHTQMNPLPDQSYVHIRLIPDSQFSMHLLSTLRQLRTPYRARSQETLAAMLGDAVVPNVLWFRCQMGERKAWDGDIPSTLGNVVPLR